MAEKDNAQQQPLDKEPVAPGSQGNDISSDTVAQDVLSHLVDGKVAEIQSMLKTLADKAEAVEQGTSETDKVADAYSDMVKAEKAVGSLESRLDALLGRLDSLLEHQISAQESTREKTTPSS
ncbi:hypothetical protein GGI23_003351 [Coemansia sp. RSA 2559]|nr:hypothetical protein GGI23_003351 [Coemansia sp. RSA 2559]